MRRPNRIAQAYGFTVCLLSLAAIASALTTIVDAAFKLSDPLRAGSRAHRVSWLSSDAFIEGNYGTLTFEQYRSNRLRELHLVSDAAARGFVTTPLVERELKAQVATELAALPSDDALRREYRALRTETGALRRFHAARLLVSNLALLAVALVLFATHWRWVNRLVLLDVGAGALRAG
jgi:hypothetical protein